MLLAKSTDGGRRFSAPVKVGDYYDLPDCATYQDGADPGRACVPEKGRHANSIFRATNYPVGAVNPPTPTQVVVTFGSYINRHSNENERLHADRLRRLRHQHLRRGQGRRRCNNDILVSVSTNARRQRSPAATTDARQLPTVTDGPQAAHHRPVLAVGGLHRQAASWPSSYYDRQYGNDETTGYSDFSVTTSSRWSMKVARATSSSNAAADPVRRPVLRRLRRAGGHDKTAYPLWSDTRTPELFLCPGTGTPGNPPRTCTGPGFSGAPANDQEVFVQRLSIAGHGR